MKGPGWICVLLVFTSASMVTPVAVTLESQPDNRSRRSHRSSSANGTRLRHQRYLSDNAGTLHRAEAGHSNLLPIKVQYSTTDGDYGGGLSRQDIPDNHKPVFTNCSRYQPNVKEEEDKGTYVFQVQAVDIDPPEAGGGLTYSLVPGPNGKLKFNIDPVTGVITTAATFDRDETAREKKVYLNVRVSDNGRPQLDDVCTIKVTIEDVNDNAPIFDKVHYTESVPQDLPVNGEVMRISATDIDDGNNSVIVYEIESKKQNDDADYFSIDHKTGVIFLKKIIDKNPDYKFEMRAMATDQGEPPKSTSIELEVIVVESHKKAPVFVGDDIHPTISLKENFRNISAHIATFYAISNIETSKEVLFELVPGRTEQANGAKTFVLESEGNTAYIKLVEYLDYETINEYTLTLRVQNKYNLAATTTITILVEDVNDKVPKFEVISGSVLENEPPGTPVMQVHAIDGDGTSANNQVTYTLEEPKDCQNCFQIDSITGNITTLKRFDREEKDSYNIKVIATDNSPSAITNDGRPNRGEHTFRVDIADKNDNKPKFTQRRYVAEGIPEDTNINSLVTEVKAEDNDTASLVTYTIVDGNTLNAFYIESTTGKIKVQNILDYETITNYTLKVRAFDGKFEDFAEVVIKIENVNDNPPKFYPFNNKVQFDEEKLVPGCIIELKAYDPDIQDRMADQHIQYYVVKDDQQKLLSIDAVGCLKLIKPLDRDQPNGFPEWQVLIAANDEDGGPSSLRNSTEVLITLNDINDNAPFLDMVQPVVWRENQPPGKITKLQAKDYDSDKNGPPFKFKIDSSAALDIATKFAISGDSDLEALVRFDREEIKSYLIPIAITDNGEPPMTGTSTLTVVIGDENDNPMKDGKSKIFIYNYKGEAPDTEIGRVYVEDPDDWDLPDKHFNWKHGDHENFDLNSDNGMITMLKGTPQNSYLLEFTVTEEAMPRIPRHSVQAIVNVTVKEIPEEAVDKSGSIRLVGITAEQFVAPGPNGSPSKQNLLRNLLALALNTSLDNVDVFTVLHSPHNTNSTLLDVRFSAHGSPYYYPEKLNAYIASSQEQIEKELGVTILMVNIDECLLEMVSCKTSCTNFLNKSSVPYAVYTNTSSFVGVRAVIDPLCTCKIMEKVVCLNGGTAVGPECECLEGFEGPNCEQISIGFAGDGWALYPPPAACEEARLSLELTPHKEDGLVFYMGPLSHNPALPVQDFMSLELKEGYPRLLVDYGSGTVYVDQQQIKLSDSKPHRIEILWSKTSIELKVDNCVSSCLALTTPQGPNEFLNVNGPLQVGGTSINLGHLASKFNWNYKPTVEGFIGCIKNLTYNQKTYNLGFPSDSKNVDPGCNRGMAKAVSFGINTNFLVAILVCVAILLILLLAVVVHRRKTDDMYKDMDDIRENIINYEDEGGGEGDMTGYDLNVLRLQFDNDGHPLDKMPVKEKLLNRSDPGEVPDICGFLDGKKKVCDNDPETNPFDDVRHYAYEGDGNTTGSLSSLASGTDEGDLNFDYLSDFGPRFRKLADMYGEDPSDDEEGNPRSESWC